MAVKQPTDLVLKTDYEDRKARLPRLNLPKFDGDVTRFREFLDQFEVSVHQQVDLSNARKLAYFCGCLITIEYGVALDALRGLSAANQGYELAVQRLKERFDRPLDPRNFGCANLTAARVQSAILWRRDRVESLPSNSGNAIRRGRPSDPVVVETVLEWFICGPVNPRPMPKTVATFSAAVELKVEDLLQDEELLYDGNRYSVRLLWRKNEWNLPDNFAVAKAVSRHLKGGWPESHHDGACIIPFCRTTSRMVGLSRSRRKDPRDARELLGSGGFHLAKWASNAPEALVDRLTEEILWNRHSRLGKTIGVSWNPQEDERLIDELTYDKRFELRS
ncbi:hypothetical protein T03_12385 [Trichinella britovi]|uniref:Uncharacterized protein n=1 Tax=Trichinella britovi TaxID=45882 RepID=A0A0V1CCK3_TRIBR|nr:hypothetical protein T03_12385 [Trichinella britovi]